MAKSHEELPQVRMELLEANTKIIELQNNVQRLELRLIDCANEMSGLNSTIRSLEVARDDAELRFLEAEDRTEKALAFVRTTFGNAGALIQALEPPKPMPQAAKDESASPLPHSNEQSIGHTQSSFETQSTANSISQEHGEGQSAQGQSAPDPTVHTPTDTDLPQDYITVEPVETISQPSPGPYHGLCYFDIPGYLSLSEWLAGGGSEHLYFHRA
jgi:hypothetical protein